MTVDPYVLLSIVSVGVIVLADLVSRRLSDASDRRSRAIEQAAAEIRTGLSTLADAIRSRG